MKKNINDDKLSQEIEDIIQRLSDDEVLEKKYKDHSLKGNWKGYRECHITPDLLLIYKKNKDILVLVVVRWLLIVNYFRLIKLAPYLLR